MALSALMARGLSRAICSNVRAQGVSKKSIYLSISTVELCGADGPCANSAISADSFSAVSL